MILISVNFTQQDSFEKCMMRANALKLHVYPVITEMTATKQIPISHVCFTDTSELEAFLVDKNLSQICSTYKDELKGIIVNECSMEEEE